MKSWNPFKHIRMYLIKNCTGNTLSNHVKIQRPEDESHADYKWAALFRATPQRYNIGTTVMFPRTFTHKKVNGEHTYFGFWCAITAEDISFERWMRYNKGSHFIYLNRQYRNNTDVEFNDINTYVKSNG